MTSMTSAMIISAAGLPTTASTSATSGGYEWEKAVLAHWCGVQVLEIHVEPTFRAFPREAVAVIEIVLTVRTTHDARTMAVLLDLPAAPSDPAVAWRSWTGWVSALSAHRPVLVTVTAPTPHREAR